MAAPMKVTVLWHAGMLPGYLSFFSELGSLPGLELSLVLPPSCEVAGREYLAPDEAPGVKIVKIKPWFRGRVSTLVYPDLAKALDELNPDILHLKQEPTHLVCLQAAAWRKSQSPKTRLVFETLQNLPQMPGRPWRWVQDKVFRESDAAVAISGEIARVLRGFGYAKPIAVLPLWVDTRLFRPGGRAKSKAPFTIGYVGRLAEEKGLFDLLDSLARLDFPWKSVWIGDGPQAARLQERARALGLGHRIRFLGALSQPDLATAFRCMDCLVLPSLTRVWWKEQFGRVLVEAMACGTPCVGSDSGSIPEVLGRAGLVFPEGDVKALARQISRLREDGSLRRKLRARGLKRAGFYSVKKVAAAHLEFYRRLKTGPARGL